MRAAVLVLAFVLTPTAFAQTDAAPADSAATPTVAPAESRAPMRDSDAETRALISRPCASGATPVGLGAWIYGMVDADNAVKGAQDRRLAAAPTVVSSGAGVAPGLALRVEL